MFPYPDHTEEILAHLRETSTPWPWPTIVVGNRFYVWAVVEGWSVNTTALEDIFEADTQEEALGLLTKKYLTGKKYWKVIHSGGVLLEEGAVLEPK